MLRFQVWTIQLETACLKLAEPPEALPIVQAARRGASDQNRHSLGPPGGKGKTRQSFGRQRVPSNARDQQQNDDRPAQVVGRTQRAPPQPQQRRGTDLQAKLDKRKARSVCHARGQTRHWAGDPQCPGRPVNVYISHISIGLGLCYADDSSQPILKSGTNFFDDGDAALLLHCKIHQATFKRKA